MKTRLSGYAFLKIFHTRKAKSGQNDLIEIANSIKKLASAHF
jgi:hypothetical protein